MAEPMRPALRMKLTPLADLPPQGGKGKKDRRLTRGDVDRAHR
ncbi:MAG: hypothetical protein QOK29_130 [Rhodospirillaceae bacterium]|nr:hypothetical protein [Rhodospirillaceae bacterium]